MFYPDSRWQPRYQGKSRDDVSGRIHQIVAYYTHTRACIANHDNYRDD